MFMAFSCFECSSCIDFSFSLNPLLHLCISRVVCFIVILAEDFFRRPFMRNIKFMKWSSWSVLGKAKTERKHLNLSRVYLRGELFTIISEMNLSLNKLHFKGQVRLAMSMESNEVRIERFEWKVSRHLCNYFSLQKCEIWWGWPKFERKQFLRQHDMCHEIINFLMYF